MVQLETFSTEGLQTRRKLEFWNDVACDTFSPLVTDPFDPRYFSGWLTRTKVGAFQIAEVYSDPQIVRHTGPCYLHHLFSTEEETVSRYVLRRRLESCSQALRLASQRGRTVTEIAFDYGFNSPTHFGRVFRAKFGVTPREYQRARLAEA